MLAVAPTALDRQTDIMSRGLALTGRSTLLVVAPTALIDRQSTPIDKPSRAPDVSIWSTLARPSDWLITLVTDSSLPWRANESTTLLVSASKRTSSFAVATAKFVESSNDSLAKESSSSLRTNSCFLARVWDSANSDIFLNDSLMRADFIELTWLEAILEALLDALLERDVRLTDRRPWWERETWDTLSSGLMSLSAWSVWKSLSTFSRGVSAMFTLQVLTNSLVYDSTEINVSNRGWNHS